MRGSLLRTAAVVTLLAGIGVANAQQTPSLPTDLQNSGANPAQRTVPGQNGKEEPSAHSTSDSSPDANAVFLNGKLNVAGIQNTDTVPAKFSPKNAEDDNRITLAYTFKGLPDAQRAAIYQVLKDQPPANAFRAEVGTELPTSVELRTMPTVLEQRVPMIEGYRYAVSDGRVMVVYPATRFVVGVFAEDPATTTVGGQRAQ
jgi:hypothetical protein